MLYVVAINDNLSWSCKRLMYEASIEVILDELTLLKTKSMALVEQVQKGFHSPQLNLKPLPQDHYQVFVQAVIDSLNKLLDTPLNNPYEATGDTFFVNYINLKTLLTTDSRWSRLDQLQRITVFTCANRSWQAPRWFSTLITENIIAFAKLKPELKLPEATLQKIQTLPNVIHSETVSLLVPVLENIKIYHNPRKYPVTEVLQRQVEEYIGDLIQWLKNLDDANNNKSDSP